MAEGKPVKTVSLTKEELELIEEFLDYGVERWGEMLDESLPFMTDEEIAKAKAEWEVIRSIHIKLFDDTKFPTWEEAFEPQS
jgi:hypothetical protein